MEKGIEGGKYGGRNRGSFAGPVLCLKLPASSTAYGSSNYPKYHDYLARVYLELY